jgi:putative transcription factor
VVKNIECEICGIKTNKIFITKVEGVILKLCEKCSKYGIVVNIIKKDEKKKVDMKNSLDEEEYELVEDYQKLIEEARKKMNISIEELAKRIGEKESLIRKVEKGEIRPSDNLIDKLEKILKVKLKEKIKYKVEKKDERKEKLRIADIVEIKE